MLHKTSFTKSSGCVLLDGRQRSPHELLNFRWLSLTFAPLNKVTTTDVLQDLDTAIGGRTLFIREKVGQWRMKPKMLYLRGLKRRGSSAL